MLSFVLLTRAGKWQNVNILAFAGTYLLYIRWFEKFYRPEMSSTTSPEQILIALTVLGIFFLIYLAMPILYELINKVKKRANPQLKILGFVINKIDQRRRIEQDYRDMIREQYGDKVFKTELKNNVKYAEAVTLKIPISFYKPKSEQAKAYRDLVQEFTNVWHIV